MSIHIKVPTKKIEDKYSDNINTFNGSFSVLSALNSLLKLKSFNYSHRHFSESTVHQGLAIEVIILDNCFVIFHCGFVHCGTPSWFICNGEYSSNTRLFFTIVEKTIMYNMNILIK